jgi:hypothetical protein
MFRCGASFSGICHPKLEQDSVGHLDVLRQDGETLAIGDRRLDAAVAAPVQVGGKMLK